MSRQKLENKIAVVTGSSKGIGAEVAKRLGEEGASVVVTYLTDPEGAAKTVAAITSAGGKAISTRVDVRSERDVADLFRLVKTTFGRIDILINNAGVYGFAPLATVNPEEFQRQFQINVLGLLLVSKAAVPLFPASGGSIVNVGSVVSTYAPPNSALAAGSKASVDTITKLLAKELGPKKIRVNSVNTGVIRTEGLYAAGLADTEFEHNAVSLTPLGRVGQVIDAALPIVFMASDDARWVTGQILTVSGGQGI